MSDERVLVIVGCSKRKIWDQSPEAGPTPAKEAYTSSYFKLCRAFAEKYGDRWLILSAKYGLIHPDSLIEAYDVTMGKSEAIQAETLCHQLLSWDINSFDRIVFLGGSNYDRTLRQALALLGYQLENPLLGLAIGLRQKKLKEWLGL